MFKIDFKEAKGMNITGNRTFRIKRNLADAGFCESDINAFLELDKKQKREELYAVLRRRKTKLLNELHRNQYKIDCLDHLIYTMKQEDGKSEKQAQKESAARKGM